MWESVPLFRGINAVNIDSKGRMAIPMRYRPRLEEAENELIVTIDTEDPCLLLYPLPEWELLEYKIETLPSFNKDSRWRKRLLMGHATEVELDGNGRILLPSLLREYAQLDKEVILVGQGKKFELWSDKLWEQGRSEWISHSSKDLPSEILNLSI